MDTIRMRIKRDIKREYRTKSRAYKTRVLKKLITMEDPGELLIKNKKEDFSDIWHWD